jgi:hypothetical protein
MYSYIKGLAGNGSLICFARSNKVKFNYVRSLRSVQKLIIAILLQLYYNTLTKLTLNEGNVGNEILSEIYMYNFLNLHSSHTNCFIM